MGRGAQTRVGGSSPHPILFLLLLAPKSCLWRDSGSHLTLGAFSQVQGWAGEPPQWLGTKVGVGVVRRTGQETGGAPCRREVGYTVGRCTFEEPVPEVPCIKSYLQLRLRGCQEPPRRVVGEGRGTVEGGIITSAERERERERSGQRETGRNLGGSSLRPSHCTGVHPNAPHLYPWSPGPPLHQGYLALFEGDSHYLLRGILGNPFHKGKGWGRVLVTGLGGLPAAW